MSREIVSFRDLDAWQVAMRLSVTAYTLAKQLPASERFELSSQVRRAAVSIPANIAEGHANGSPGVCIRHLRIALGSLAELATHFELGRRMKFFSEGSLVQAEEEIARTGRLLHGLLRAKRQQLLKSASAHALLPGALAIGWMAFAILN